MTILKCRVFLSTFLLVLLFGCGGGGSSSNEMATGDFDGTYQGVWNVQASSMTADFSPGGARPVVTTFSDTGSNIREFNIQATVNGSQIFIEFSGSDTTFTANGMISSSGTFSATTSDSTGIFTQVISVANSNGMVISGIGATGQYTFSGSIQNNELSADSSGRFRSSTINDLNTNITDLVIFVDISGRLSASRASANSPVPTPFEIEIQL